MDEVKTLPYIAKRDVHDFGHVILEKMMGDELDIVNNARVSFDGESVDLSDRDKGLINFLMREKHSTPFEAIVLRFDVKVPLFVAREWQRHRISSFNEMSARYSPIPQEYYVPDRSNVRQQHGKPGDYYFTPIDDDGLANYARKEIQFAQERAFMVYNDLVEKGIAKETARTVLPVGMLTRFKWGVNLRSLLNFLALRNHKHAQEEIRVYAEAIEEMLTEQIPYVMQCWNEHGRVSI